MNCISQGSDKIKDHDEFSPINAEFLGLGLFGTKHCRTTIYGYLIRKVDVVPSTTLVCGHTLYVVLLLQQQNNLIWKVMMKRVDCHKEK